MSAKDLYSVKCKVCSGQCTVYSVQCTECRVEHLYPRTDEQPQHKAGDNTDAEGHELIDDPLVPELLVPDDCPEHPGQDGAHQGGDQHRGHQRHGGGLHLGCSALLGQYSAVQCTAVQCSARQCTAAHCSALQCTALHCSSVQILLPGPEKL